MPLLLSLLRMPSKLPLTVKYKYTFFGKVFQEPREKN